MNTLQNISIIKTLLFNIRYFGIASITKMPVYIGKNVVLEKVRGEIILPTAFKRGMIRIGFENNSIQDKKYQRTIWNNNGTVQFNGTATIGCGARIYCMRGGVLQIGGHFCLNGNSEIICAKNILFGENCNVSWECLFMDSDFHSIVKDEMTINRNKPIEIGNHVWIGCRCTFLKGSAVSDNSVVAANSCMTSSISNQNIVIGRNGEILKENINWEMDMPN